MAVVLTQMVVTGATVILGTRSPLIERAAQQVWTHALSQVSVKTVDVSEQGVASHVSAGADTHSHLIRELVKILTSVSPRASVPTASVLTTPEGMNARATLDLNPAPI